MDTLTLLTRIGVALVTSGLIGLEREKNAAESKRGNSKPHSFGGVRTHLLFSILGILAGLATLTNLQILTITISFGFMLFIIASYILSYLKHRMYGLTSEIGGVITFFVAFFIVIEIVPIQVVVALAIVSALVLGMKQEVRLFVMGFSRSEILDVIKFGLVALVILPLLPNKWYGLGDLPILDMVFNKLGAASAGKFMEIQLFNPFKLWFVVVFVSGLDLAGYLVNKMFGGAGELLAGITGGFVTSTSTVQGLAVRARRLSDKRVIQLAAIACMANAASYVQTMIMVAPLNVDLFLKFAPFLLSLIVTGFVAGIQVYKMNITSEAKHEGLAPGKSSFSLGPALKFASLLLVIQIFTKVALVIFGNLAFFVTSVLASLTGIDAIVINLSELAGASITMNIALYTFFAVTAVNTAAKTVLGGMSGGKLFMKAFLYLAGGTFVLSALFGLIFS